jgi:20S proteasome alpha/beta subunit
MCSARGALSSPAAPPTNTPLTPSLPTPHTHIRSGWKATAVGMNSTSAMSSLKNEYKEELSLPAAVRLGLKTLTKAMDTTAPTSDKVEVAVLTRDDKAKTVVQRFYTPAEVDAILKEIAAAAAPAGDV